MSAWLRGLGLLLLLALPVNGCGSDSDTCTGGERCACYANGTCNTGLRCLSNTCVDAGDDSGEGGAAVGDAGSASGGNQAPVGGAFDVSAGAPGDNPGSGASSTSDGGAGGASPTCRTFETYPDGTAPTVFVLVDGSGSMFHCLSTTSAASCPDLSDTPWAALKAGTLDMIQKLEGSVRFGFGTYAGEQSGTCPDFTKVAAALNNSQAIEAVYSAVTPPTKGETPTSKVLGSVKEILSADPSPGRKYVLLVTDGEPDFCDDGNSVCAVDASVGALQDLHAAGITTLIFGVDSTLSTVSGATLQAFADAGAGQPVSSVAGNGATVKDQCQTSSGWVSAFNASGAVGSSVGSYGSSGGATVFRPDPTDQAALTKLFATAVSGIKSCLFDLAAGLSVDLTKLASAKVTIEGQSIPRDDSNGWRMKTPTQLELRGSACELWHDPDHRTIDFKFPCGVVVGD
jgi:hypothetical protein